MYSKKFITYPNSQNLRIRWRGRLPHFEIDGGIYFVTFRLADALPLAVIDRLDRDRRRMIAASIANGFSEPLARAEAAARFSEILDLELDRGRGNCYLYNPKAAAILNGAIRYFDEERYRLLAWSVMPNHAHVVFHLEQAKTLCDVLQAWKSYAAHMINKLLNRRGTLFQREYFDRVVRDVRELEAVVRYTDENPARSGIQEWPFHGRKDWWLT